MSALASFLLGTIIGCMITVALAFVFIALSIKYGIRVFKFISKVYEDAVSSSSFDKN